MASPPITLSEVFEARRRIAPHLRPTPLYPYAGLDELVGARLWVKHENHQPVGAFKVRGGVNLVSQLSEDERRRGLIAASTGNHGQTSPSPPASSASPRASASPTVRTRSSWTRCGRSALS